MLENKKFGLISLGCDKNRVDAERLLGEIKSRGYAVTDEMEDANILIVNTCAFLQSAREEALDTVLECNALRGKNLEKIVVSGCLPEKYVAELFPALTEADVFLGCSDSDKLLESLERSYSEGRINAVGQGKESAAERVLTTPAHYAYLKIADGCDNFCTYCLIPKIRGRYRSEPMEKLVGEARELGEVSELILVAQDTTRYGTDHGESRFVELIRKLSSLENIRSIRLLYCYPDQIDDALIAELKNNPKLIKYLDIPFQHSEDRILKLMNRKGSREDYLALLKKLRENVEGIAVRSTFIAGFPTETEEEAAALGMFLKEAKLTNCGFFAYSREPDTAAYRLKGQIPARVKQRRVKELYGVQAEISRAFLHTLLGKKLSVVCDGIDYERKCFVGRAYFSAPEIDGKVYFNAPEATQGETYEIIVTDCGDYDLFGQTEDFQA